MFYNLDEYEIRIFRDDSGEGYVAAILEMPGVSGCSDSPEKAFEELKTAFALIRQSYEEDNEDMPEPFSRKQFSGQFRLRLPKDLHSLLAKKAMLDNVSLNQEVLFCIMKGLEIPR